MNYPEKPKNKSPLRVIVNSWGCLLGIVMLALGAITGLFGSLFIAPQLLGFNLTATALSENAATLEEREILLAATSVDLEQRAQDAEAQATNFALDVQATQAIIVNERELLGQTATQSAQNNLATLTAISAENVRQQTQIAINYQATQAQLQSNATQAEIEFRNTQAALGIPVTQSSNIAVIPNAAINLNPSNYLFVNGFDEALWRVSDDLAWGVNEIGLVATQEAWILESEARLLPDADYRLEMRFQPAASINAAYCLLILGEEEGLAIYLNSQALNINEVAFYSFSPEALENGRLSLDNLALISRTLANQSLSSETSIELVLQGDSMRVLVDGEVLHTLADVALSHGRVGLQLPQGATLLELSIP